MNNNALTTLAVKHRRALHAIPEIGLKLPKTKAYIRAALEALAYAPADCADGLVLDIGSAEPRIALRADMDALPIREETGLPYASTHDGAMHACGHDAHAAALLAAAAAYKEAPPAGFSVRLMFQAGEEGSFGAVGMIEAGCLKGVSAIAGGHVGNLSDEIPEGGAGFKSGCMMAASDRFKTVFKGSGGHGSAPQDARDPIPALAEFVLAANNFRSRVPDQRHPFVLSVCQAAAGSAFNIIPCNAECAGTVRTVIESDRNTARAGLERLSQGIAAAHELDCDFAWFDGYPPLVNNDAAVAAAAGAIQELIPHPRMLAMPCMGGEDFAYYAQKIPACFWFMNTNNAAKGISHPNHHPQFDVDEDMLGIFAAGMMSIATALARI